MENQVVKGKLFYKVCEWWIDIKEQEQGTKTGIQVPVRETSLGNQNYRAGDEVSGVLIDNYFNICREFNHTRKGKLFGYIKENDKDDEWTKIVIMEDFRPKMMASVSFYPNFYEAGEELTARKSLISNF